MSIAAGSADFSVSWEKSCAVSSFLQLSFGLCVYDIFWEKEFSEMAAEVCRLPVKSVSAAFVFLYANSVCVLRLSSQRSRNMIRAKLALVSQIVVSVSRAGKRKKAMSTRAIAVAAYRMENRKDRKMPRLSASLLAMR